MVRACLDRSCSSLRRCWTPVGGCASPEPLELHGNMFHVWPELIPSARTRQKGILAKTKTPVPCGSGKIKTFQRSSSERQPVKPLLFCCLGFPSSALIVQKPENLRSLSLLAFLGSLSLVAYSCSCVGFPGFLWPTHWCLPEPRWLKEGLVQEGLCLYTSSCRGLVRTLLLLSLPKHADVTVCVIPLQFSFSGYFVDCACWFLMQKICAGVLSRLHGDFLCSGVYLNYSCSKV